MRSYTKFYAVATAVLCSSCAPIALTDTAFYQPADVFCDQLDEAGMIRETEGGATGSNGHFKAQLITDGGIIARDTNITANAYYVLESVDVGGGERLDKASSTGIIEVTLGAGRWSLRVEGNRGCSSQLEFQLDAAETQERCILLECPQNNQSDAL